jgi:hypothetical protein
MQQAGEAVGAHGDEVALLAHGLFNQYVGNTHAVVFQGVHFVFHAGLLHDGFSMVGHLHFGRIQLFGIGQAAGFALEGA